MEGNKVLHVAFCADSNYLEHFTVALSSVLKNNKDIKIQPHFVYDGIAKSNIVKVEEFFKKKFGVEVLSYSFDSALMDNFKISHHINKATYFRFLLADILPKDIDTLLFLDCDLIVNGALEEFFNLKFDNKVSLYAANHYFPKENKKHLVPLGLHVESNYFNAGVLYIDLKYWREEQMSKILIDFALKEKDNILWWDQDVLNVIFKDSWKELAPKYNLIWESMELQSDSIEILEAQQNPVVIHYTRSIKPWHDNSWHPHKEVYWKYRENVAELIKELN